jgi:o-succinylbenzoate synthase
MIIDGVEVVHVAMPLIYPWRTAYGADPVIESVLVKFTSGSNVAWGEACTLGAPTYSPEHAAGIFCVLKEHFVNLVVGKEFDTSEDLQYALRWFKGNQFAKVRSLLLWRHRSSRITYGACAAGCTGHRVVGAPQHRTRLSTPRLICRSLWPRGG